LPKSYAVARELEKLDDRFEIIKDNPNLAKAGARKLLLEREGNEYQEYLEKKNTPAWMRKNVEPWFKRVCKLAVDVRRQVNLVRGTGGPGIEEVLREVIGPSRGLLPSWRDAGEALIQVFNYVETVLSKDEDAEPAEDEDVKPTDETTVEAQAA
jgi:hypothetical protein